MLFEAVIGSGSLDPCRLGVDFLLACQPGHRRPREEWLKRGLHCRKLVCPPRFQVGLSEERVVRWGSSPARIVIAVDPHKASWTAAAVDVSLQPLASIRVPVSRDGYRALRRFARRWPNVGWAIEGAPRLVSGGHSREHMSDRRVRPYKAWGEALAGRVADRLEAM